MTSLLKVYMSDGFDVALGKVPNHRGRIYPACLDNKTYNSRAWTIHKVLFFTYSHKVIYNHLLKIQYKWCDTLMQQITHISFKAR